MTFELLAVIAFLVLIVVGWVSVNRQYKKRQAQQREAQAEREVKQQLLYERMDKTLPVPGRGYEAPPLLEDNELHLPSEENR